jgi:hypothetical protein
MDPISFVFQQLTGTFKQMLRVAGRKENARCSLAVAQPVHRALRRVAIMKARRADSTQDRCELNSYESNYKSVSNIKVKACELQETAGGFSSAFSR